MVFVGFLKTKEQRQFTVDNFLFTILSFTIYDLLVSSPETKTNEFVISENHFRIRKFSNLQIFKSSNFKHKP